MDPVLVTIPIRRPLHYMALEPFFRIAGLGALMRWCRAFPVSEEEADGTAVRTAIRLLRAGEPLVIFPEGGRSPDGGLQPFRPGAFRIALHADTPIVPVTIAGAWEAWPPQRRWPRPGRIRITYHPPVTGKDLPAGADRRARPEMLTELVRERIAAALPAGPGSRARASASEFEPPAGSSVA
jgi:1-acyl-sn-glycerol-3-phosphate acyltransferase